jgi:hypothetical protein
MHRRPSVPKYHAMAVSGELMRTLVSLSGEHCGRSPGFHLPPRTSHSRLACRDLPHAIDQSGMRQPRSDQSGRRDVVPADVAILLAARTAWEARSIRQSQFTTPTSKHDLFRIKGFGYSLWGIAPNPAQSGHCKERVVAKPAPPSLAREMPPDCFNFVTDLVHR